MPGIHEFLSLSGQEREREWEAEGGGERGGDRESFHFKVSIVLCGNTPATIG